MRPARFLGVALLSAIFMIALSCEDGEPSPDVVPDQTPIDALEPIKIGYIDSISGTQAFSGTHGRQGAILAVEEINEGGGILGRPVDLIVRDDKSEPADGVAAMRDLVDQGVVIVFGGIHSGVQAAISEVAREARTPYVSKGGYAAFLTEAAGHRYYFRIAPSGRVLASAMAQEIADTPYRRICTVGMDFAYGHDITETTLSVLEAQASDAEVASGCEFWPPIEATEFGAVLTSIDAANPEVVVFSGVVAAGANAFVRQAKSFGLTDRIPLFVHSTLGLQTNVWALERSDVAENVVMGSDFPNPLLTDEARAFDEKYRARWGEMAASDAHLAYVAMYTIRDAIEKAGQVDKEEIVDALEGLTVNYLTGVEGTIRPFDHQSTVGWFVGQMTWDEENGVAGMTNVRYVEGGDLLLTEEEIAQIRQ